jgi:hypothetical protein
MIVAENTRIAEIKSRFIVSDLRMNVKDKNGFNYSGVAW